MIFPKPNFSAMQNNFAATPSNTVPGTTITSHASANTKGNYSQLISSTNYDVYGISLGMSASSLAGSAINTLLDIAIGGAGSEVTIVDNLLCGSFTISGNALPSIFLPLFIPKGTRIAARCQDAIGSDTVNAAICLHGGASYRPWRTFSKCETIGAVAATSKGLVHTAGNTGAESTWADIGSPLARDIGAIFPVAQCNLAITAALAYHLEFGVGAATFAEYFIATTTNEVVSSIFPNIPHYCTIPSGSQLQIRAECSGAGEQVQFGLLGFY